jgi:hypothetical protein
MIDDPEQPQSFEAFEAEATKEPDEERREDDQQTPEVNDQADPGDEQPEEAPEAKPEEDKVTRSKRWQSRVDALTARLREAEHRALTAEQKAGIKPAEDAEEKAPDPNDEKYEFGEADPKYASDIARFEARQEAKRIVAEERNALREQEARGAVTDRINDGMANIETEGVKAYEDFEQVVTEAAEARGEPLHPMIGIGLSVSPVGHHLTYALAKDEKTVDKLEKLVATNPKAAALAFGELEGEHLPPDHDDADLDLNDPLDMMRMNGRMKARLRGAGKQKTAVKPTNAPEPPKHNVRGTSGKFETDPATTDFAAFERKAKREAAG